MPISLTGLNAQFGIVSSRQYQSGIGARFAITNPTPGTAIAYAAATSFSATANGLFMISNPQPNGGKSIYLDRLMLLQTATAPVGTALRFEVYNESAILAMTGNVATRTPVTMNQNGAVSVVAANCQSFAAGAATVPAAKGNRILQCVGAVPVGVNVAQDVVVIEFGADGVAQQKTGLTAARATDPAQIVGIADAVVIAPQTTSWINLWGPGTNAPSYEFQLSWTEL